MLRTITRARAHITWLRTVVVLGVAAAATSAVVALGNGPADNSRAVNAVRNYPNVSGAHRLVRAVGLDPAQASHAFEAPSAEVAIVRDTEVACLVLSTGDDQCYPQVNVRAGRGFSITNDCSAGSNRSMVIEGFAPSENARFVEVRFSDGSSPLSGAVTSQAYRIEARTPSAGEAYPVKLLYLDKSGVVLGSQAIPDGDDLCLSGVRAP